MIYRHYKPFVHFVYFQRFTFLRSFTRPKTIVEAIFLACTFDGKNLQSNSHSRQERELLSDK